MRTLALFVALMCVSVRASAAPPQNASNEAPEKDTKPADDSDLESPYGDAAQDPPSTPSKPESDDPQAERSGAEGATDGAPASGDPKLDAPPTTAKEGSSGPALSPLNPEPEEFPSGKPNPAPPGLDALIGDIATLRSRVAALMTSLFSSKLRVYVETEGDEARIDRLVVTLDDGVVFASPGSFIAEDPKVVYEHAVAPGDHVLGVEIERHDARNKAYRTHQTTRLSVNVPDKRIVEVELLVVDDSDMGEDFPEDQDGEYELGVNLRARVADE